jgi:hypothetical protein
VYTSAATGSPGVYTPSDEVYTPEKETVAGVYTPENPKCARPRPCTLRPRARSRPAPDIALGPWTETWRREFFSFVSRHGDWLAYVSQDIERRARDYADAAPDRYYDAAGIGFFVGDFRAARDVPGCVG